MEDNNKILEEIDEIFSEFKGKSNKEIEEMIKNNVEEDKNLREQVRENQKEFLEYARTLPGSEKEMKDNPIVRIVEETIEEELVERAATAHEVIDNFFDELFAEKVNKSDNNSENVQPKRK